MVPNFRSKDAYFVANHNRQIGNEHYANLQFKEAIFAYNVSLCFSNSLEAKGIVFANRAAAYLALQSYQDCLDSFRLAKECPLPANIMKKVLAREKIAIEGLELKDMTSAAVDSSLPVQLSHRRNKRMPSFAFCLKLKDADPYGGIITTENILPGDVLVVEPPLSWLSRWTGNCDYCLRECGSLKPCKCGQVLFCSPKCKEDACEAYHNYECPLMDRLYAFSILDCAVLRVFFKLIQRFKDVSKLREYLENIKSPNPFNNDEFEAWSDPGSFESQFRIYYATERPSLINCTVQKDNLFRTDLNNTKINVSMAKTAIIINILKAFKQLIPSIAKNEEEWSFLSEQLFRLIYCKAFTILNIPVSAEIKYVQDANNEIKMEAASSVEIMSLHGSALLFRTSCQANVYMNYENNMLTVRAQKAIPRGTELLAPQE